jgi:hypothetical protein
MPYPLKVWYTFCLAAALASTLMFFSMSLLAYQSSLRARTPLVLPVIPPPHDWSRGAIPPVVFKPAPSSSRPAAAPSPPPFPSSDRDLLNALLKELLR